MSFIGAYTKLHRIENGEYKYSPPKILDEEKFYNTYERVGLEEDAFADNAVLGTKEIVEEYPDKKYLVLYGFKTWSLEHSLLNKYDQIDKENVERLEKYEYPLGTSYNISQLAIFYCGVEEVAKFFKEVSKSTEPFVVWHGDDEITMPFLHSMDYNGVEEETVYRIECRDGSVDVYEVQYEKSGEEVIFSEGEE